VGVGLVTPLGTEMVVGNEVCEGWGTGREERTPTASPFLQMDLQKLSAAAGIFSFDDSPMIETS
jgi:hypothetical protein